MRLLTYNIHGCVGRGGTYDPGAVLEVLQTAEADVVALQEVHGTGPEFMTRLQELYPASGILEGPTMKKEGEDYGNLLLSRIKPEQIRRINLNFADREPRGAIRARIHWNSYALEITATHLGLIPAERHHQIDRLLDPAAEDADVEVDARILMGDLNEWWPFSRANRRLRRHYGPAASPRTFPARLPLVSLDRIHVHSEVLCARTQTLTAGAASTASDHLPLLATLEPRAHHPSNP